MYSASSYTPDPIEEHSPGGLEEKRGERMWLWKTKFCFVGFMVQNVNEGEKMMEIDLKVAVRAVHFFCFPGGSKLKFAPSENIA